jgi:hypothetical protein
MPRLDSCAASLYALKIGVAHPQTISPAIKSITMAAVPRPFACLQCAYSAKTHGNMVSHIMYKHVPVRAWRCTEPNCTTSCARW